MRTPVSAFPLTRKHAPDLAGVEDAALVDRVNARYGDGTIPHRAVRDLARYESERARLAAAPPARPQTTPLPGDDAKLTLSPSIHLLMYGADLPRMLSALREGKAATARPCRGWILMVSRSGGKVDESELDREGGWVFEWFREPTKIGEALEMLEERDPIEALWKQGFLIEAR
jgi:hypothetical protein